MSSTPQENPKDDPIRIVPIVGREPMPARLPTPLTPLIGRASEVRSLEARLCDSSVRLVTLTGAGGTGKTRLALELASRLRDQFADGVAFVPLAAISDPDLIIPTIARALGVRESGGRALQESLVLALRERELLLVIDNVEQVIAGAPRIGELLTDCPNVVVLATSRERLRLRGEHLFPVAPLSLPAPNRMPEVDALPAFAAVALVIERGRQIQPDFTLTSANAADVVAICQRLDGLPLALELAASHLSVLSPAELLARLERRLPLLTGGDRDLPERLRTMRDAIAWSYDLLSEEEQCCFRRLAVFAGGFTLDAAEAVGGKGGRFAQGGGPAGLGGDGEQGLASFTASSSSSLSPLERSDSPSTLDLVASLMAKSLLRREESQGEAPGGSRFAMLETVREFGLEQLAASGEWDAIGEAHARYCLNLAETAENALTGSDQAAWLDRLDSEHDNMRAALLWVPDRPAQTESERAPDLAPRLAAALWRFWWTRGYLAEGRSWLARALDATSSESSPAHARALRAAGDLAETQGDYEQALVLHNDALAMFRALDDRAGIAQTLNDLAIVWQYRTDYDRAIALFEESLAISRGIGDRRGVARCLTNLAGIAYARGDFERAAALYEDGLSEFRALGDLSSVCTTLSNLGEVALRCGDNARAMILNQEAIACQRRLGDRYGAASAHANLAEALWRQGQHDRAITLLQDALQTFRELGDARLTAVTLYHLGRIAQRQDDPLRALNHFEEALLMGEQVGDRANVAACLESLSGIAGQWDAPELAVLCLGSAEALRDETGAPRLPSADPDFDRWLDVARSRLDAERGADAFAVVWERGRALSVGQLIDRIATLRSPGAGPSSNDEATSPIANGSQAALRIGLTPRELEVVRLIDQGLSGRQIAETLFISPRTCTTHVTNICGKFGVTSRTAALAAARRLGIL